MDGVADKCAGEDTEEGSGCFLGRPGLLLFFSAALSDVGTLFCCPRLLESPCKPEVIEITRGGGGSRRHEGRVGCKWWRGNETDVDL